MSQLPSIRKTLWLLLREHGTGLCYSAEKCKTTLMDNCLGHQREIDLLVIAIEREITSEMLRLKETMPVLALLQKLTRWMTHETTVSEADCRWIVDSWAMALGVIPFSEMKLITLDGMGYPHATGQ